MNPRAVLKCFIISLCKLLLVERNDKGQAFKMHIQVVLMILQTSSKITLTLGTNFAILEISLRRPSHYGPSKTKGIFFRLLFPTFLYQIFKLLR